MENWRSIPGFEGYYEVSDLGNLRSLDRVIDTKQGPKRLRGRVLRPAVSNGYLSFSLWRDHKLSVVRGHHAVAAAFIGPRPPRRYVCHWDGDRKNNCRSNLYYGSPTQNVADARRHGTLQEGERAAAARLTAAQVLAVRRKAGETNQSDLAEQFGVSQAQISRIINRRKWRSLGMS